MQDQSKMTSAPLRTLGACHQQRRGVLQGLLDSRISLHRTLHSKRAIITSLESLPLQPQLEETNSTPYARKAPHKPLPPYKPRHLTKPVAGIASQSGRPFVAEPPAPKGPLLRIPWRTQGECQALSPMSGALWPLKSLC